MDPYVKAQAVRKLTYLQMMGYDVSWASFAIVETMSQARFAHKRIGYLAACQCFSESTDVVLLTTNLLKKEFQSTSQYEVGLAVNCLANIVTKDLARDLLQDSVLLMSHSKPYVRKKAVSSMFKLFVKYPQGLRLTFEKLKERLADGEPAVTSCAVNVVCELANKNPNNYLSMAPQFFRLLTTSSNNWMLIKVVKLMGALVPQEPRLARKLLEPLATIIQNTAAKSLQYECIHTLTLALPFTKKADGTESRNVPGVVRLCADHLRQFIDDADQNLKYLGLVGFVELMKSHPKAVVEHKELVLLCLSDDDVTIRTRALELLTGMVTRKNLEELVVKLLAHVNRAEGAYRDELISRIVHMCSRDKYSYLSDFVWYLSVLVRLAHLRGSAHGALLAEQLVDITMRVRPVRRYAARDMVCLLLDDKLAVGQGLESIADVLSAAAWIAGEYAAELFDDDDDDDEDDDDDGDLPKFPKERPRYRVVDILTHPRVTNLPARVQNVYLQNALKVLALFCDDDDGDDGELEDCLTLAARRLDVFLQSVHVEVQERATAFRGLLVAFGALKPTERLVEAKAPPPRDDDDSDEEGDARPAPPPTVVVEDLADLAAAKAAAGSLSAIAAEKMVPVNPKAQGRVPAPADIDLGLALNGAALDAFFNAADPDEEAMGKSDKDPLGRVHFVDAPPSYGGGDDDGYLGDDFEERGGPRFEGLDLRGSDDSDDGGDDEAAKKTKKKKKKEKKKRGDDAPAPADRDTDDPFYLAGRSVDPDDVSVDDVPVVRLTAADLKKDKKSKKEKKKKGRKVQRGDVDVFELMPEGALNSDDEAKKKRKDKKKKKGLATNALLDMDATDLSQIDITTPLRDDEVMPSQRHRVVAAAPGAPPPPRGDDVMYLGGSAPPPAPVDKPKKDKAKKEKKAKEPKKKKEKKSSKAAAGGGDLLDLLDFGGGPQIPAGSSKPAAAAPRVESFENFDLLGDGLGAAPPAAKPAAKPAKKAGGGYKPLFSQGAMRADYRAAADGLDIKVSNTSASDLFSNVSLAPSASAGVALASGGALTIAASLPAGASASATLRGVGPAPDAGAAPVLDAVVAYYVEGLVADLVQARTPRPFLFREIRGRGRTAEQTSFLTASGRASNAARLKRRGTKRGRSGFFKPPSDYRAAPATAPRAGAREARAAREALAVVQGHRRGRLRHAPHDPQLARRGRQALVQVREARPHRRRRGGAERVRRRAPGELRVHVRRRAGRRPPRAPRQAQGRQEPQGRHQVHGRGARGRRRRRAPLPRALTTRGHFLPSPGPVRASS